MNRSVLTPFETLGKLAGDVLPMLLAVPYLFALKQRYLEAHPIPENLEQGNGVGVHGLFPSC
jgi:hypothetical protein